MSAALVPMNGRMQKGENDAPRMWSSGMASSRALAGRDIAHNSGKCADAENTMIASSLCLARAATGVPPEPLEGAKRA
jgi:hypothetical protein